MGNYHGSYGAISVNKSKFLIEKNPGSKSDYGGFGHQIDLAESKLYRGFFLKANQPLLSGIIHMVRQSGDM